MFKLALASLRFRFAASLATFVAVTLGCAILVACGGIFETALRLNAPPERLANAPIVVSGEAGYRLGDSPEVIPYSERSRLPASLQQAITRTADVTSVVADNSFSAVIIGSDGGTASGQYGHPWQAARLTPYNLRRGVAPQKGEVAISAQAAQAAAVDIGQTIPIAINGTKQSFVVSGIVAPAHDTATPTLFFADAEAKTFAVQNGRVDAFGVFTSPDTVHTVAQRLQQVLPADVTIRTGDDRGLVEFTNVSGSRLPLLLLGGVFSGMVLVVMILVISATIGLSVRQRQQELALLRASGATPKQVRRMVVVETMLVALLAIAAGVYLGDIGGDLLYAISADHGVLPSALRFQQGLIPLAAGALVALGVTWLTAKVAAGGAARTQPIQAMVESTIPPASVSRIRRWMAMIFGIGTVSLAGVALFMGPELASAISGPAVLTGSITVGLIAPELLYAMVAWLSPVAQKLGGGLGMLAVKNVRSRAAQFAAVLTPLVLAVGIAAGNIYSQTSQQQSAVHAYARQFHADAIVGSIATGLSKDTVSMIQHTQGVTKASPLITSHGWIEKPFDTSHGSDPWPLIGLDAQNGQQPLLRTPVVQGSLSQLNGDTVALPQGIANKLHIAVNDRIGLRLGDSTQVKVKVIALLQSSADYPSLVLPASLLAQHTSTGLPMLVLVQGDDIQGALRENLRDVPDIQVGDDSLLAGNVSAELDIQGWINYLVAGLAIAYAAIAAINATTVVFSARRKEFAMQRLIGATRRQVYKMVCTEGLLIAVIAVALGTIIAAFTAWSMAIAVGLPIPAGSPLIYLGIVAAILVITLPVTYVATRTAVRQKPIEAVTSANE